MESRKRREGVNCVQVSNAAFHCCGDRANAESRRNLPQLGISTIQIVVQTQTAACESAIIDWGISPLGVFHRSTGRQPDRRDTLTVLPQGS